MGAGWPWPPNSSINIFFCYKFIPFKVCFNVVFFYFLIQAGRQAEKNLYLNFSKSQIFSFLHCHCEFFGVSYKQYRVEQRIQIRSLITTLGFISVSISCCIRNLKEDFCVCIN